eukprot:snap_masked-scaffold_8-processed-gene-3.56-mRNA-1 protein AED:0.01 eAED:0.01 QI:0/-1/0/1/-1/1/1/0/117
MIHGRWMAPQLSAMKIAKLRKNAIVSGLVKYDADWQKGEWDPRWDISNKAVVMKPPRGNHKMRNGKREARVAEIQKNLKTMDEKIKARSKRETTPISFLENLFVKEGIVKPPKGKKK